MLELLNAVGVDPKLLFWAFLGSICSIFVGPRNLWVALGNVAVGTVFGTGFGAVATKYTGVPPEPTAIIIGLTGMILAKVLQRKVEKWWPSNSERKTT